MKIHTIKVQDIEGVEMDSNGVGLSETERIESCENIINNMPQKPVISNDHFAFNATPCYIPLIDLVYIPSISAIKSATSYYSTLFHEIAHSTGHQSRLNREGVIKQTKFGSSDYAFEELVAELGAFFLCAKAGIKNETEKDSAVYLNSWIKGFNEDYKFIFKAASFCPKSLKFCIRPAIN
ncbi:MAG TPA: zincin-like metallopeptidase domain-containing protein [Arachidicoccus soli]|nr:zincin-like metallopeptidase domain-containing protein [Arachidicoccus soli]